MVKTRRDVTSHVTLYGSFHRVGDAPARQRKLNHRATRRALPTR